MVEQGTDRGRHELTEEVMSGMAEWQVQYPRATVREIEQEVDVRLAGMRARLVQDVALRRAQRDVGALPQAERPACPQGGTGLETRGKKTRG